MYTQTIQKNTFSIRHILVGNAVFSAVSGVFLTLAPRPVSTFLGLDDSRAIFILGLVAITYAVLLFYSASRPPVSRGFVLFTVLADSLWVAVSILLLVTGWVPFSVEGKWAVGIAAMLVDVFATLEFLAWRKM